MKTKINYLFIALLLCPITAMAQRVDLSGTWRFAIDRSEVGIKDAWYNQRLSDSVRLPGSMLTNGRGDEVSVSTPWVGSMNDSTYFKSDYYAQYRCPGNIKVPFWLQPDRYYAGVAWYQRDVDVPADWRAKTITLFFERSHWQSRVWIDGLEIGMQDALSAPHEYDLTGKIAPGHHVISVRVDNKRRELDPGENSHSVSDHTQGNWNGIVGAMYLEARPMVHVDRLDVYPSFATKTLGIKMNVENGLHKKRKVVLTFSADDKNAISIVTLNPGCNPVEISMPLPEDVKTWDEFSPNLYHLTCTLVDKKQKDERTVTFGCRDWSVKEGQLMINGHPTFMRGTLHCAAFPLTGYPATDKAEWLRELKIIKAYGHNHVRFHSWCPPEAAFEAADELGMYLYIECSSWANQSTTIGDGKPVDAFVMAEAERIVKEYGNHPSFCMMSYGNEPGGARHKEYLQAFVTYWHNKDNRRIYTTASGWPNLPDNDFLSDPNARIQRWGEGLNSIINGKAPQTGYDWRDYVDKYPAQPMISHEIGEWCVYPDFKEIKKYTGVYKAKNFEIFRQRLVENGMAQFADSFLLASGKLQTLCYKADIEAALRTPRFGGFETLGLNDFPGQGTALVGSLNVFWEDKGYVTAGEYSRFCNSIVPLARMQKLIFNNDEQFSADVEIANYKEVLNNPDITWTLRDKGKNIVKQGRLNVAKVELGNCRNVGRISFPLNGITDARQLNLEVKINEYANDWNIWVYPIKTPQLSKDEVLLTDTLDKKAMAVLNRGGKVILSIRKGTLRADLGGDIRMGFSSIFWNTSWTNNQPPHTLGILCDPASPALKYFPTDYYSDYQWWDAMKNGSAIRLDKVSGDVHPIVRVIDDWFTARPLALIYECKMGKGRLIVSGVDFMSDMQNRPAARQLLYSLKEYLR